MCTLSTSVESVQTLHNVFLSFPSLYRKEKHRKVETFDSRAVGTPVL